jgi:hypothetical protein
MKIYRYIVAFVLGLNGAMLVAIGIRMILTVDERISQFGLDVSQSVNLAPIMHALGVSDAVVSIFSFLAMILVLKGHAAGRILSFVVGAHLLITGVAIYLLTSGLFGLFFIASRGVVIVVLSWLLQTDKSTRPG